MFTLKRVLFPDDDNNNNHDHHPPKITNQRRRSRISSHNGTPIGDSLTRLANPNDDHLNDENRKPNVGVVGEDDINQISSIPSSSKEKTANQSKKRRRGKREKMHSLGTTIGTSIDYTSRNNSYNEERRRRRRVTLDAMDVLGNLNALPLKDVSNQLIVTSDSKGKLKKNKCNTKKTKKKKPSANSDKAKSTSLGSSSSSSSTSKSSQKVKKPQITPEQNQLVKNNDTGVYDEEESLDLIIWHGVQSTMRKKRKLSHGTGKLSECSKTSLIAKDCVPVVEFRSSSISNSSVSPLVTEHTIEIEEKKKEENRHSIIASMQKRISNLKTNSTNQQEHTIPNKDSELDSSTLNQKSKTTFKIEESNKTHCVVLKRRSRYNPPVIKQASRDEQITATHQSEKDTNEIDTSKVSLTEVKDDLKCDDEISTDTKPQENKIESISAGSKEKEGDRCEIDNNGATHVVEAAHQDTPSSLNKKMEQVCGKTNDRKMETCTKQNKVIIEKDGQTKTKDKMIPKRRSTRQKRQVDRYIDSSYQKASIQKKEQCKEPKNQSATEVKKIEDNPNDQPSSKRRSHRARNPVEKLVSSSDRAHRSSSKPSTRDESDSTVKKGSSSHSESETQQSMKKSTKVVKIVCDISDEIVAKNEQVSNDWDDHSLQLLLDAHKKVDPKSFSFWHQVAARVPNMTAEQCREKWFALVKTPTLRRKKSKKETAMRLDSIDDSDDIFNSTPVRNAAKILSSIGKSSVKDFDEKKIVDKLSSSNLSSTYSHYHSTDKRKWQSSPLQIRPNHKGYLKKVTAGLKEKRPVFKKQKIQKNGLSKKKPVFISAAVDAGDIHMDGILSPSGTLRVEAPDVDEVENMYLPNDISSFP